MSALSFIIPPEGISRFGDAILCLAKFGENVSIEAQADNLRLTTLNSSKSAYASFQFDASKFFTKYHFGSQESQELDASLSQQGKFTCQIYNKALLAVFKGRAADTSQKETAVERCEVNLQDQRNQVGCRFIVKMICRHGVVKTYKFTYESIEVVHAIFNKKSTQNTWSIQSKLLREFIEYFGAKTEQLDIYSENGRATFTSYTEKITDGKEVLKQPLHTSISLDTLDFTIFEVPDHLHIGISVRDFKSIVTHAETLHTLVTARFSRPGRPMQLVYEHGGMLCEFTLMTLSDSSDTASITTGTATPRMLSARPESRPPPSASVTASKTNSKIEQVFKPTPIDLTTQPSMPPPLSKASSDPDRRLKSAATSLSHSRSNEAPSSSQNPRQYKPPSTSQSQSLRPASSAPPPPQSTLDPDSLFIPLDDDSRWDEPNFGDDDEDMLGWDASADHDELTRSMSFGRRLQDATPTSSFVPRSGDRIEATQRVSQIRGLFD